MPRNRTTPADYDEDVFPDDDFQDDAEDLQQEANPELYYEQPEY